MSAADDIKDAIIQNAAGPKAATGDAGSVEMHPLPDLIDAAKYLASQTAASQKNRGLRFSKMIPPGAV